MRPDSDTPIPLDPSQLVVGLYVWIDLPWTDHPFLTSRRLITSQREIALIHRSQPTGLLYYYPQRSRVQPPPAAPPPAATAATPAATVAGPTTATEAADEVEREFQRLREDKRRRLARQHERGARMRQGWDQAARQVRTTLQDFMRSPRSAGERLRMLGHETALQVAGSEALVLHMLGERLNAGAQHHALNVMMLSLLLGQRAGLSPSELADLGMAALAHDAGEADIPAAVLRNPRRRRFEEDFYRQHVTLGLQMALQSGQFSPAALALIAEHHEAADGSGWPQGRRDAVRGARILAMADRFDRLCNPLADGVAALSPAEALARMVRHEAARFDAALLALLVQLLGAHPPGSLVQLSDGSVAMVIGASTQADAPRVRLHAPELAREDAPEMDLSAQPEVRIARVLRHDELPDTVRDWFDPALVPAHTLRDGAAAP
ncbi:MAG: HD-GYP domain-containing protein [Burkholderiaceae bacterium]